MERPSRRTFTVLAAVLAAAVLGGGIGAATVLTVDSNDSAAGATTTVEQPTSTTSAPVASATDLLSIAEIAKRTTPSVVEITVSGNVGENAQGQPAQQAQGSGWVYDAEGHVITNQHVVEGASSVRVMLHDGKLYPATWSERIPRPTWQ